MKELDGIQRRVNAIRFHYAGGVSVIQITPDGKYKLICSLYGRRQGDLRQEVSEHDTEEQAIEAHARFVELHPPAPGGHEPTLIIIDV